MGCSKHLSSPSYFPRGGGQFECIFGLYNDLRWRWPADKQLSIFVPPKQVWQQFLDPEGLEGTVGLGGVSESKTLIQALSTAGSSIHCHSTHASAQLPQSASFNFFWNAPCTLVLFRFDYVGKVWKEKGNHRKLVILLFHNLWSLIYFLRILVFFYFFSLSYLAFVQLFSLIIYFLDFIS